MDETTQSEMTTYGLTGTTRAAVRVHLSKSANFRLWPQQNAGMSAPISNPLSSAEV